MLDHAVALNLSLQGTLGQAILDAGCLGGDCAKTPTRQSVKHGVTLCFSAFAKPPYTSETLKMGGSMDASSGQCAKRSVLCLVVKGFRRAQEVLNCVTGSISVGRAIKLGITER